MKVQIQDPENGYDKYLVIKNSFQDLSLFMSSNDDFL